ncbi:hypothetical protein LQW54_002000 [Pestalotiopsis sp. IQ-011]
MPFYWYPEEGATIGGELVRADIIANSLQLAAKLHEILIIMSLSAIRLSIFRRRLVSGGVRLGSLTGEYRVGNWAYLCSSAFRQQSLDRSRPWELLLSGFLVLATTMSTLAGPASTVLLVPTLGWYSFNGKTAFENITLPLVYYNTSHEYWSNTTVSRVMQQLTFNDTKNGTSPDYMGSLVHSDTATKISLARVFGAYLTESLARISSGTGPWVRLTQTRDELSAFDLTNQHGSLGGIETVGRFQGVTWYNNQSFDDFVVKFDRALKIGIEAERYGSRSGQRRRTLDFAVAMMCIYLGTVLVYGLVIGVLSVLESAGVRLWGGPVRVLSVVAWSDLQDLVLLALRKLSPRDPDLADVGAGIASDQVWKKNVRVGADDDDSVQLGLGDLDGTNELETAGGKKYY